MEYKGYYGKVEVDEDAGLLHGEVLGIRDIVTFQGKSVREVRRAFRESVDDYLAFCKERGEEPDKPYSGQFVVRVSPELHRAASNIAKADGKSLNALVEAALAHTVSRKGSRTRPPAERLGKGRKRPVKAIA